MISAHYGLAFAAATGDRRRNLPMYMVATQWADALPALADIVGVPLDGLLGIARHSSGYEPAIASSGGVGFVAFWATLGACLSVASDADSPSLRRVLVNAAIYFTLVISHVPLDALSGAAHTTGALIALGAMDLLVLALGGWIFIRSCGENKSGVALRALFALGTISALSSIEALISSARMDVAGPLRHDGRILVTLVVAAVSSAFIIRRGNEAPRPRRVG